jgi:polysaccharide deacetylase family protein (PEP-CTERM system associated)
LPSPPRILSRARPGADPTFLFSVDLEDIRSLVPDGGRYADRVVANTECYLELLERHDVQCTFFTTGDVARRYPDLLRRLVAAGHEIGSHTSDHLPLDRHTPESFRDDMLRCLEDFDRADVPRCVGFRAPVGSLIEQTSWAWEVIEDLGFTYSSSVCTATGTLYGWPGFGRDVPQKVGGIWEIPTSICHLPGLRMPFAGGVFFRVLPFALVRWLFERRHREGHPIAGYIHPYDVDTEQERFMHPEIDNSRFYNWLLYFNRRGTLSRVDAFVRRGYGIVRYDSYVDEVLEASLLDADTRDAPPLSGPSASALG